jgi:hypothetical protein
VSGRRRSLRARYRKSAREFLTGRGFRSRISNGASVTRRPSFTIPAPSQLPRRKSCGATHGTISTAGGTQRFQTGALSYRFSGSHSIARS